MHFHSVFMANGHDDRMGTACLLDAKYDGLALEVILHFLSDVESTRIQRASFSHS